MKYHGIPNLEHLEEWTVLDIPFEYNDFMFPKILDQPKEAKRRIQAYLSVKRDRSEDTMHGPFLDITVHSDDILIQKASNFRIRQACEIALKLQVKAMILHTNFIPNFYEPNYRKGWVDKNEAYFKALLRDYPSLYIYMENMFDEEPDGLIALANRMKGYSFGICLDIAHANISKTPIFLWQQACEPFITHYHINDNDGHIDSHLPLGKGNISWREIMPTLKQNASLLLEVNSLEKYKLSQEYLSKLSL